MSFSFIFIVQIKIIGVLLLTIKDFFPNERTNKKTEKTKTSFFCLVYLISVNKERLIYHSKFYFVIQISDQFFLPNPFSLPYLSYLSTKK